MKECKLLQAETYFQQLAMAVLVETTLGDLVIDLYVKERPKCSMNFLKLCKMKFYNLCQFYHIDQNYIAQTGDPTSTGRGGESIFRSLYGDQARFFEKEDLPKMRHTRMGIVSFVNNGENMLGSQFFITLGNELDYLDDKHTIFGQVTEGLETLELLNEQLTDDNKKPFKDIRISHTIVLDDPFEDSPHIRFPSRSPSPTLDMLVKSDQIALDEKENEDEGKTAEEIEQEIKEREMAEQAQILEIVGDLRHADEAPPDNVLFVCKLNPVTTDEDLEIIFSRFGKIACCEIIRDRRTKASLQYAFIEFEDAKSCEQAFFKMDNVLIDDRRIHVDFSQSVSKNYKWDKDKRNTGQPPPAKRSRQDGDRRERNDRKEMPSELRRRRESSRENGDRRDARDDRRREERRRSRSKEREKDRRRERDRSRDRKDDDRGGHRKKNRSRSRERSRERRRR